MDPDGLAVSRVVFVGELLEQRGRDGELAIGKWSMGAGCPLVRASLFGRFVLRVLVVLPVVARQSGSGQRCLLLDAAWRE